MKDAPLPGRRKFRGNPAAADGGLRWSPRIWQFGTPVFPDDRSVPDRAIVDTVALTRCPVRGPTDTDVATFPERAEARLPSAIDLSWPSPTPASSPGGAAHLAVLR